MNQTDKDTLKMEIINTIKSAWFPRLHYITLFDKCQQLIITDEEHENVIKRQLAVKNAVSGDNPNKRNGRRASKKI